MPMTSNTWYTITLDALADPPYAAGTYTLPSPIVDLLITGSALAVFCLTDGGVGSPATIAFLGGTASVPSGAVNISTTPTMDTTVMDDGETWYSIRTGASGWLFYGDQSGMIRKLTNSTTLGAFIA